MISRTTLEKNERGMILNEEREIMEKQPTREMIQDFEMRTWIAMDRLNKYVPKRGFVCDVCNAVRKTDCGISSHIESSHKEELVSKRNELLGSIQ